MLRSVFNQINIGGVWTEILASRKTVAARSRRRRGHLLPLLFIATLLLSGSLIVAEQPLFAESRALPVAQSSQGIFAVAGAQGADLYDQPDGTVLESLLPGTTLTAVGRTADSRWLSVETSEGSSGWVAEATVVIFGEDQLPVVSDFAESAPTADADQAEASATAADAPAADVTGTAVEEAPATATAPPAPTATPSPTAVPPTPTPVPPTPTPVPPTPTPVPPTPTRDVALPPLSTELIAVVGSEGTTLYPEWNATSGTALAVGTALSALARTDDNSMLYVRTSDGATGWVVAAEVVAFNTRSLPVEGGAMAEAGDAEASDTEAGDTGETMMAETPAAEEEGAEDNAAMAEPTTAPTATTAPTVTNTPLPTPTPTQAMRPTPDADGRTTAQVAMSGSRLNIRSGPSTAFPVIGKALPREVFIVQGRNGDNTWVQLAVPDLSGGFGWVSTQFVVLSDPIATLPIVLETNDTAAPTSSTIAAELASAPTAPATTAQPATAAMSTTAAAAAQPAGLSGTMVLQSEWGGTFYLYELASGALRPVTGGLDPALSPDGSMIAFTRIGDGAGGLYLINRDGSDERQIFKASEQIMAPKWSPDGKWVVFSRANGSYTCNDIAFVGCISDGQLFPVPPGGLPPALEEARDEVLDGFERVSRPNWQLSRVNLDGKEYRDIAALDSARTPDWTNAGIVYQSAGGLQITQDTPDGDTRQVYHDGWDWDPDWQPNGGRIVFQSKEGPHWEIFAVNPDGTGLAALTRPVTTLVDELPSNVAPVWSPDGQYVAYLSNRMENNEAGPWRVWVMNADGSNQHPLPINLDINYGFAGEQMISWEQ